MSPPTLHPPSDFGKENRIDVSFNMSRAIKADTIEGTQQGTTSKTSEPLRSVKNLGAPQRHRVGLAPRSSSRPKTRRPSSPLQQGLSNEARRVPMASLPLKLNVDELLPRRYDSRTVRSGNGADVAGVGSFSIYDSAALGETNSSAKKTHGPLSSSPSVVKSQPLAHTAGQTPATKHTHVTTRRKADVLSGTSVRKRQREAVMGESSLPQQSPRGSPTSSTTRMATTPAQVMETSEISTSLVALSAQTVKGVSVPSSRGFGEGDSWASLQISGGPRRHRVVSPPRGPTGDISHILSWKPEIKSKVKPEPTLTKSAGSSTSGHTTTDSSSTSTSSPTFPPKLSSSSLLSWKTQEQRQGQLQHPQSRIKRDGGVENASEKAEGDLRQQQPSSSGALGSAKNQSSAMDLSASVASSSLLHTLVAEAGTTSAAIDEVAGTAFGLTASKARYASKVPTKATATVADKGTRTSMKTRSVQMMPSPKRRMRRLGGPLRVQKRTKNDGDGESDAMEEEDHDREVLSSMPNPLAAPHLQREGEGESGSGITREEGQEKYNQDERLPFNTSINGTVSAPPLAAAAAPPVEAQVQGSKRRTELRRRGLPATADDIRRRQGWGDGEEEKEKESIMPDASHGIGAHAGEKESDSEDISFTVPAVPQAWHHRQQGEVPFRRRAGISGDISSDAGEVGAVSPVVDHPPLSLATGVSLGGYRRVEEGVLPSLPSLSAVVVSGDDGVVPSSSECTVSKKAKVSSEEYFHNPE
ncbi:unnamed protein product, partial [Choristocarpus tenellus]